MATAQDVLRIAQAEVGYDRYNDPEKGTKYGRWYEANVDKCASNYDFGANGVPYCAMFVSWALNQANVRCKGFPGAYCPTIHLSEHLRAEQLEPGDVALFDWEDDGTDDHVGFVKSNNRSARTITTIEGNTSGGKVAERTRAYSTICGGIRPDYDGVSNSGSSVSDESNPVAASGAIAEVQTWLNEMYGTGLEVDNYHGPKTKAALVKALQIELNKQYNAGLAVDGIFGPKTKAACVIIRKGDRGNITKILQGALICLGYTTGGFDGIAGEVTDKAIRSFQAWAKNAEDGEAGPETFSKLLA